MSGTWFRFVVASVVVGGLYLAVTAQEPEAPPLDKGKKVKLFEFKAPGVKGGGGGPLDALRDKKIQEEIGLLPVQIAELEVLSEQAALDFQAALQKFQALPKEEQKELEENFRRDMAQWAIGVEREIQRILLPEQWQRLRQTALQLQMKKGGATAALTAPEVLRELGVSEAQEMRIRDELARIEAQYRQKALDLQTAMQREILALFTPPQQQKLQDLIGPMMIDQGKQPSGGPKGPKNSP